MKNLENSENSSPKNILDSDDESEFPEIPPKFSQERLIELDSEGRCVMTDHGSFVLFNVYLPNGNQDNKRRKFKVCV